MAHAEGKITIARPVQEVFAFILDGENCLLWQPSILTIRRTTDKPLGVGTRFKQSIMGPGGRSMDADYEIIGCQPGKQIRFQVSAGQVKTVGTYTFQALGDLTAVTVVMDCKPPGLLKLADAQIEKQMKLEVEKLAELKAYLEQAH
jgi:uncharacterized membrane protein